ncbi:MAG: hypothetical protein H0V27_12890 [Pyrinomonadaceae bacterium]|nr:hypothetical protein [Pyrinomonadaceae bacterium]
MNKWVANITMLCTLLALIALPSTAKSGFVFGQNKVITTDIQIPVDYKVSAPCLDKEIQLTGKIKAQFRLTGGSYLEADISYEGISGTILPSGIKYEADGTSNFDYSGLTKQEFIYVGTFVLNKPKSFESLMARVKLRIGVNRKGEVTATVKEVEIDCST